MIDKFLELFGKIFDNVDDLWKNELQPFIAWLMQKASPIIVYFAEESGRKIYDFLSVVCDVTSGITEALGGLLDFLMGNFTRDWEKAWEGIKTIVSGIWAIIKAVIFSILSKIYRDIQEKLSKINEFWQSIWRWISSFSSITWQDIKKKALEIFGSIRDKLSEISENIKKELLVQHCINF